MGRKPLGDRALGPAERQKKWRLRHPAARQKRRPVTTATGDDYAERQAAIKACSALVERLRAILQTPPAEQSAKVALWRLGDWSRRLPRSRNIGARCETC